MNRLTYKLSEEHIEQFNKLVSEKWAGKKRCFFCEQDQWTLIPEVVQIKPCYRGGALLGGPVYPHVLLVCTNCGHTHFFNAKTVKIIESDSDNDKK